MSVGDKGLVTVFGGSGFVGRAVVRALAKDGYRVRVAVRRPDLAGFLMTAGGVGQVQAVQANLRYPASVKAAVQGASLVINCVGILAESGHQRFLAVQAQGAKVVAEAAAAVNAKLIHISAIGADSNSASVYARSKAQGESAVLAAKPDAVILRPSIVFGEGDEFYTRFAAMAVTSPALPLIGGGQTRFQPVFVQDVASAVMAAVDGRAKIGTVYELGGPQVVSFKQILEAVLRVIQRKRLLAPLPFFAAGFIAKLIGWLPGAPITTDQVELLKNDNVVSDQAKAEGRTLEGLGITATGTEGILPGYLWRFRKAGQFAREQEA